MKGVLKMEQFQQQINAIIENKEAMVLATLIHVEGSSYRKTGATMLLNKDETTIGMISGGCLEEDLYARSEALFGTGKSEVHQYDLSSEDDLGWGLGAGCNGVISILIRDIDEAFRESFMTLSKHLIAKEPVLFIQSIQYSTYTLYSKSKKMFGNQSLSCTEEFDSIFDQVSPFTRFNCIKEIDNGKYFLQIFWPERSLYIIGAGSDARPLAKLAGEIGFLVHVLDWRESLCTNEHFPKAHSLRSGEIVHLLKTTEFHPFDSVVIMTHNFQQDKSIIAELQHQELFYLGVLGSKKRAERLINGILPDHLHSPVGISIGADGPHEIAISIVAELIAERERKIAWKL